MRTKEGRQSKAVSAQKKPLRLTRRSFLKLPMAQRRRILAQQSQALAVHYSTDVEWRETEVHDFLES
ncbi:MAG TPA: hypothetical protein VGP72_19035 [Planctomycetota bacterium]|jgi:hypothetical protein